MSRYSVEIKEQAQHDLKVLSKSEPKAYLLRLIEILHYL
jgi:mRNA-degrading endonuclease RelE of RelBE toxin-antitoxin system